MIRPFEKHSNLNCALKAFKLVKMKYPRAEMTIIGSGSQHLYIQRFIENNQILGVELIDSSSTPANIEIMLKKRNIKTFAVVADDDFIFMNVLDKIFQVLPLHIGFNRFAVIKGNSGYIVEIAIQSGGFDIQISNGISELGKESPGLV